MRIACEMVEKFTKMWYNETKKGGERMNFLHCDRDENMFSLHDCITDRVYFQDKELIFDFPDGFWVLPDHPASDIDKVVRTDAAKVTYTLIDDEYDVTIYVFEKSLFGQTIRKEWSIGELADKINSGKCKLEFLYRYNQGNNNAILMCNIRVDKKPYFKDCWIEITYASLEYAWNHLCEDRTW